MFAEDEEDEEVGVVMGGLENGARGTGGISRTGM